LNRRKTLRSVFGSFWATPGLRALSTPLSSVGQYFLFITVVQSPLFSSLLGGFVWSNDLIVLFDDCHGRPPVPPGASSDVSTSPVLFPDWVTPARRLPGAWAFFFLGVFPLPRTSALTILSVLAISGSLLSRFLKSLQMAMVNELRSFLP